MEKSKRKETLREPSPPKKKKILGDLAPGEDFELEGKKYRVAWKIPKTKSMERIIWF